MLIFKKIIAKISKEPMTTWLFSCAVVTNFSHAFTGECLRGLWPWQVSNVGNVQRKRAWHTVSIPGSCKEISGLYLHETTCMHAYIIHAYIHTFCIQDYRFPKCCTFHLEESEGYLYGAIRVVSEPAPCDPINSACLWLQSPSAKLYLSWSL